MTWLDTAAAYMLREVTGVIALLIAVIFIRARPTANLQLKNAQLQY
ncbi:hypothetical protein ACFLYL_02280 [Chloroflexota bacterium]